MRFGLFHSVQWPRGAAQRDVYLEAVEEIVQAEALGYHSAWLTEHHFSRHGIISDSLSVLSHLAGRTSRIRLGTAVTVLPFHNPIRLAETAATVDLLSDGRLDLGIGRGYQWSEFNGFGMDMTDRAARFDECLDIITRSWASEAGFEHAGPFWNYGLVDAQPKPVQQPHPPIWVATDSEDGLRRCAVEGWGVMLPQGRPLKNIARSVELYRTVLSSEGIPFDPEKLVVARALHVGVTDEAAWATAGPHYSSFIEGAITAAAGPNGPARAHNPFESDSFASSYEDSVVFGSPETCARKTLQLRDLGVEYIIWFTRFGSLPHADTIRTLQRFASEVRPALPQQGRIPEAITS
jgi:alkanesulfonate monooxygenase SsuD/methylene tetrahydromethanopterin reductase-like flavin-dependent oxidoreductase (luciferase family)